MAEIEKEFKVTLYAPRFDGKRESYRIFKQKMRSYLAYLGIFVDETTVVPRDDANYPANATEDEKKEIDLLKKNNKRAAGVLLQSIDTSTDEGEAAFEILMEHHDSSTGYAGGNFPNEWKALANWYERNTDEEVREMKTQYYKLMMKRSEQPSLFVLKMNKLRADMKRKGFTLPDDEYLLDMVGKLPKSSDPNVMGPYDTLKKDVRKDQKKAQADRTYDLKKLCEEMEDIWLDAYGSNDADDDDGEKARICSKN